MVKIHKLISKIPDNYENYFKDENRENNIKR